MTRQQGTAAVLSPLLLLLTVSAVAARLVQPINPPRGWNSYDCQSGLGPNSTFIRDNAKVIAQHLKPLGYEYVVADGGWFRDDSFDAYGRPIPNKDLFPELNGSFKNLVVDIENLGLKFGVWHTFGVPQAAVAANLPIYNTSYHMSDIVLQPRTSCPWDSALMWDVNTSHPGALAYYKSNVELWQEWGLSFLKMDCVFANNFEFAHDIEVLSNEIKAADFDMVLSLSPGGRAAASQLKDVGTWATMARITGDFWDTYATTSPYACTVYPCHFAQAETLANASLVPTSAGDIFLDHDMLPFGRIGHYNSSCTSSGPGCSRQSRLTEAEQRTVMSLWSINRSPLMLGADTTRFSGPDDPVLRVVGNTNILDLDHTSRNPVLVWHDHNASVVWKSHRFDGEKIKPNQYYVAIFNVGDSAWDSPVSITSVTLGLEPTVTYVLHELWTDKSAGELSHSDPIKVTVPSHDVVVYMLTATSQ